MPLDVRYRPSIRLAYASLAAWGLWIIWAVLTRRDLADPSLAPIHFLLLGVGFAGNLVMGLAHHLTAHFSARRPPPPWLPSVEATLVGAATAGGLYALLYAAAWLLPWASLAWALALAVFAAGLLFQMRGRPLTSVAAFANGLPGDRVSDALQFVIVGYALFAGAAAWLDGMIAPPAVHLWLVGVVALTIFMVTHRVLPRFSRKWMPKWVHWSQGALASVGPVLLAIGMGHSRRLALWGGTLEYAAVVLYVLLVAYAWIHRKNQHPAVAFPALGAGFLFFGVNLGILVLHNSDLYGRIGVHAVNNLFGFVVLTTLGMASAMLGLGVMATTERANRRVWRLGLAATIVLVCWEALAWWRSPAAAYFALGLGAVALVQASWVIRLKFAGKPIVPRSLVIPMKPQP